MPTLLFVCTGNLCRSPMASALFKKCASERGDDIQVESAGTWGIDGEPAAPFAREVMAERGLSLDAHTARNVTGEMLERAALVIVMTRNHRDALAAEFPAMRHKLRLLSQVNGIEYDITDPYGKPRDAYELCADSLQELIERGYEQILLWLAQVSVPVPNA